MDYYESKNPQYLVHFGVLGMKWGRRKHEARGGLPSAKKIKKRINRESKKYNNDPDEFQRRYKNTAAVEKRINKEHSKTKEYKEAQNLNRNLKTLYDGVRKQSGPRAQLVVDRDTAEMINRTYKASEDKYREIRSKHIDDYAGAFIKDLGYEDTKAGREYLRKKKIVS